MVFARHPAAADGERTTRSPGLIVAVRGREAALQIAGALKGQYPGLAFDVKLRSGGYARHFVEGVEAACQAAYAHPDDDYGRMVQHAARLARDMKITAVVPTGKLPSPLADPIPIVWLRSIVPQRTVKGDSSKLTDYLKRRSVHVFKFGGKNLVERAEALKVFRASSKVHKLISEYGNDGT